MLLDLQFTTVATGLRWLKPFSLNFLLTKHKHIAWLMLGTYIFVVPFYFVWAVLWICRGALNLDPLQIFDIVEKNTLLVDW